jgi:hypothetical protein
MLQHRFESALEFTAFVQSAQKNATLWRETYRLARVPGDAVARLAALPGRWHLLVIVEDWCGDAVNTVPLVARLAELAGNTDVRVVARDENPELMDAHLTNGSRSIPVVIVLDEDFVERGWWGPRPSELQRWVMTEGMALEKDERYRRIRTWYARDRGRTAVTEVVELLEQAARETTDSAAA